MNKLFISGVFLVISMISGCYTQLGNLKSTQGNVPEVVVDSTGDTVKQNVRVDTLVIKERQNCVWERDIWGYPQLRCYDSYYPRDWFFYTRSPWWFRNDPFWYDYRRCPRFYYYDQNCKSCRHYQERAHHSNSGSASSGATQSHHSRVPSTGGDSRSRSGGLIIVPSNSEMSKTGTSSGSAAEQFAPSKPEHRERNSNITAVPASQSEQIQRGQQSKTVSETPPSSGSGIHGNETHQPNPGLQNQRARKSSRGL